MRIRSIVFAALIASAGPAFAQPPAAGTEPRGRGPQPAQAPRGDGPATAPAQRTPAPAAPEPAPRARREGQPVNVRVEVTVSDQRGTSAPVKKTVTVVVADSMGGRVRSNAQTTTGFNLPLNIDAEPQILADGKIRLMLNLQYDLPMTTGVEERMPSTSAGALRNTQLQENLPLVLENGKAMIVAQAADPISDRQVTVEVKATVLR